MQIKTVHSPKSRTIGAAAALCLSVLAAMVVTPATAFYGLDLNDLPRDGDVTVPGDYPIMVRRKNAVQLSGLNDSLTLNLVNPNSQAAVVQILAPSEKKMRTLRVLAGVPTLYNTKNSKEVTLRVADGDVTITSIHPLKVQHSINKAPAVQK
ncbi:MAG: hypothetical protein RI953_248 [Pseudomonadota bacterium]|jgi:hypothetical protein